MPVQFNSLHNPYTAEGDIPIAATGSVSTKLAIGATSQRITRRFGATRPSWEAVPYLHTLDYYDSGDGSDYALAVNRAIAEFSGAGIAGEVILPNRAEAYSTEIVPVPGIHLRGGGSGSEIIQSAATTALIRPTIGTFDTTVALDADAFAGSITVTLPTGGGASFARSDFIAFESDAIAYGTITTAREIRAITAISGDVLTIEGALLHDYLVADSATYAKVNPVRGYRFSDFSVTNPDASVNTGYAILLEYTVDAMIDGIVIRDAGGGIGLQNCLDVHVSNITIDRLRNGTTINPAFAANGYGIWLYGSCAGITVSDCTVRSIRHAITTVAGAGSSGGPRECTFSNIMAMSESDGLSTFDTHEAGDYLTFNNCIAEGGGIAANSFQVRAKNVTLNGCRAIRSGARGISVPANADNCTIIDCEVGYTVTNGISLSATGGTVRGGWIHNSGTTGGIIIGNTTAGIVIDNVYLTDNHVGVVDQGSVSAVIRGCTIPMSTGQTVAISALSATSLAVDNVCLGYSNPDLMFQNANALATFRRNNSTTSAVRAASGNLTLKQYDRTVFMTSGASNRTVTLAAAASLKGEVVTVVKVDAGIGTVILDGNASETINGATTYTIPAVQYNAAVIMSDGSNWFVTGVAP